MPWHLNLKMATSEQTSKRRVVGDLSCQSDSYLKTLETEVISCEKAPKQVHKSKKNNGHSYSHDEWLIECADSVLFPEGITLLLF